MDIQALIENPINVVTLIAVIVLVAERMVTGGWLSIMLGKKPQSDMRRKDDELGHELLARMETLELHFNHETTEQYQSLIRGQDKILDVLQRIERDGVRIKS